MKLWTEMADRFRAAGLTVQEYDGWKTRGEPFQPIAVMAHHTAPPVPFPVANLAGVTTGNIKCNVNIKPDGLVIPVAAGRANYSAGTGSRVVLDEVRAGVPPAGRAIDRRLTDDGVGGSSFFFGIEVDHPGDGTAIPQVQLDALHKVCAVLLKMLGEKHARRLITHAEWTPRKIDPYWNSTRNTGPGLRDAVAHLMVEVPDDMPTAREIAQAVWSFPGLDIDGDGTTTQLMLSRAHRNTNALWGALVRGDLTTEPSEIAEGLVLASPDLARAVVDEINRRLAE